MLDKPDNISVAHAAPDLSDLDFHDAVIAGLKCAQKQIPSRFLYDHAGSTLFEDITHVAEYYPTRIEITLLETHAKAIGQQLPADAALVEFGSGSSRKTPLLVSGLRNLAAYVPIDISEEFLLEAAVEFSRRLPDIKVTPVTGDFSDILPLPSEINALPKIGFFPGSTIGNLLLADAKQFLERAKLTLGANAWFLIGVDLQKSLDVLIPAYDDKAGVTAAFNINLLRRINRELGGNFNISDFAHEARYSETYGRIEMHLVSQCAQTVMISGEEFIFEKDESIHTENSHKYTIEGFQQLALNAGWHPENYWCDDNNLFSIHLLKAG